MSILYEPPPTEYDLKFVLFDIPVRIHPLFWLFSILFGLRLGDVHAIVLWVCAVLISVLVHELGHSLMMQNFGQSSYIVLHTMGGMAVPTGSGWRRGRSSSVSTSNQQILISLAGPFAGFALAAIIMMVVRALGGDTALPLLFGFIPFPQAALPYPGRINLFIDFMLWTNVFWGLINLLPVYPLDGGQAIRQVFLQLDPWGGIRKSLWLSVIAGSAAAILGFVFLGSLWMALLFGILAIQSYQRL
ncbi:MAG: hypothetical protein F6J87_28535 [Spirulina sp. SIO3F2]|nr:hypothetical protein [Spirulina sp. SIO3F2]